ncbi:hypothetical protein MNV49_002819 [Pseudohyphozyma bogoriensis]|nr:hypothetical protein MNV49_002819 [Pseudohyphozyma bogoriensis]
MASPSTSTASALHSPPAPSTTAVLLAYLAFPFTFVLAALLGLGGLAASSYFAITGRNPANCPLAPHPSEPRTRPHPHPSKRRQQQQQQQQQRRLTRKKSTLETFSSVVNTSGRALVAFAKRRRPPVSPPLTIRLKNHLPHDLENVGEEEEEQDEQDEQDEDEYAVEEMEPLVHDDHESESESEPSEAETMVEEPALTIVDDEVRSPEKGGGLFRRRTPRRQCSEGSADTLVDDLPAPVLPPHLGHPQTSRRAPWQAKMCPLHAKPKAIRRSKSCSPTPSIASSTSSSTSSSDACACPSSSKRPPLLSSLSAPTTHCSSPLCSEPDSLSSLDDDVPSPTDDLTPTSATTTRKRFPFFRSRSRSPAPAARVVVVPPPPPNFPKPRIGRSSSAERSPVDHSGNSRLSFSDIRTSW